MRKAVKVFGFGSGSQLELSRKKRKGGVLVEKIGSDRVSDNVFGGHSRGFEAGDTTETENIDMEEECLMKETSFNYGEGGALGAEDLNQMPKSSRIKTVKALRKPLKKINYDAINDNDGVLNESVFLLPSFSFKPSIQVLVCKSFALDIDFEKLNFVRKIFSSVNGFERASISSKFGGIIHAIFTSEKVMMTAARLTNDCGIVVNTDLKHPVNTHLNRAIVLKEILVGTSVETVHAAVSKFEKIKIIKMQLVTDLLAVEWSILINKDAVRVARADIDKQTALLYTLPNFIGSVNGKTCVIDCNSVNYNYVHCATVCFSSEIDITWTIANTPVIRRVGLHWSRLVTPLCSACNSLGYSLLVCKSAVVSPSLKSKRTPLLAQDKFRLVKIYEKKSASIFQPLAFVCFTLGSTDNNKPLLCVDGVLEKRLNSIESSLISLAEQIGELVKRLDSLVLVVSQPSPGYQLSMTPPSQNQREDIVMRVGSSKATSGETVMASNLSASLMSSNWRICWKAFPNLCYACLLTLIVWLWLVMQIYNPLLNEWSSLENCYVQYSWEIDNLILIVTETKLKGKIHPWIMNKFDGVRIFTLGLDIGHLGSGVHVCKILDIPGQLFSIKLLFGNKLSVSIVGLYTGASLKIHFFQASDVNSMIAKAVNESFFIVLGDNFNKDSSHKSVSFKKCFELGLVNSLGGSSFAKTIDYLFISSNLVNAVVDCDVFVVDEYFNTNHNAISVSIKFEEDTVANAAMFHDEFCVASENSAEGVFGKKWFKGYNSVFNEPSSRFHKLELLVSRIVKASCLVFHGKFVSLLDLWGGFDLANASVIKSLFLLGSHFNTIWLALARIRKSYCSSKLSESVYAKESQIRSVIDKKMESFELNKDHTIWSVLEHPFCKVVLDHLVVGDELILELDPVKSRVNKIMEGWTHSYQVVTNPLDYVFDEAFSGVMNSISFNELFGVVSDLSDGKAAGLSGISNELWKHCDRSVLDILLVLLNSCLLYELVLSSWRKAWVSMISKPYKWEDVLTNTYPIALIEMAHKILSKILSNKISSACSVFDILHGNNFLVLKSTTIQSPIFAIGSIVKDALEKNREFWLVLQDMCGCAKSQARLSTFFVAGAFVDDTIWVGSSQSATQHILDVASEFFRINDKTVAILINSRISILCLSISGVPIAIARKSKFHHYLGIFFSTEGLSRPSLAKAHSNIQFFTNLVLRKAVSDKQFLYLVLAVLYSIVGYRTHAFCFNGEVPMSEVLSKSRFSSFLPFLWHYGIAFVDQLYDHHGSVFSWFTFKWWKKLDSHGPVPDWFKLSTVYLNDVTPFSAPPSVLDVVGSSCILGSSVFFSICYHLSQVDTGCLSVYIKRSLKNLGTVGCRANAAAYFENINLDLNVGVSGLMSSILVELQAIILALECILHSSSVCLFSNSQSALDACKSELGLLGSDFHNQCWIECQHIANIVCGKNLRVGWHKVKGYLSVVGNKHADEIAGSDFISDWFLPSHLDKHFLVADGGAVSGNSKHFVHDIFCSICHAHWKIGLGSRFLVDDLVFEVDWS
ncbi:hypothetical protein G9A89_012867 [Geosiphon pyriformis]|nr:hypothetical protein G9A89_012867 [Geosiphon pyriformis]